MPMSHWMFKALVSLDQARAGHQDHAYPSEAHGLMVCAGRCNHPSELQYFRAVIVTDDDQPLVPGDRHSHTVTVTVNGDEPGQFFRPGQHFAVWNGSEIGHGVVSRRVFFS
ncbi:MAG TPA: hypothetical protein VGM53_11060 [Streptosporangiaceae bacterium]|jgi:hypothetical protein